MNAKQEFLKNVEGLIVKSASLSFGYFTQEPAILLKEGHTYEQYLEFLSKIDREYDAEFGGQELYGIILCGNGIWFTRGEYDGSEWWNIHKYPEVPDELK